MDPPAALVGLWAAACPVLEAPSNHNDDSQPPPSSPGSRGFQCGEDGNAILPEGARPVARRTCSGNVSKPVQRSGASNQQRPHHPAKLRESAGMSVFDSYSATKHCVVPASTRAQCAQRAPPGSIHPRRTAQTHVSSSSQATGTMQCVATGPPGAVPHAPGRDCGSSPSAAQASEPRRPSH
jgi:hypothetical protein